MLRIILIAGCGLIAGAGAVTAALFVTAPEPLPAEAAAAKVEDTEPEAEELPTSAADIEVFEVPGRIVVPLLDANGDVTETIVMGIAIETDAAGKARLRHLSPRVRSLLVETLLAHANRGGFEGRYTAPDRRAALVRQMAAALHTGVDAKIDAVLITDVIARGG